MVLSGRERFKLSKNTENKPRLKFLSPKTKSNLKKSKIRVDSGSNFQYMPQNVPFLARNSQKFEKEHKIPVVDKTLTSSIAKF